jgi:lysophospholipase L1-like esterase
MPYEVRAVLKDDHSLQLKVLSDKPYGKKQLALQAGGISRHFNLQKENKCLFTHEWEFPVRKLSPDEDRLQFFFQDSLFFEIDMIVLHRIYDTIAEPNRFEQEIRIFEIIDHFDPIPPNSSLITGSSTIRRWKNIDQALPELDLINLGFGGSTMEDLNYYAKRIILPYNPARIIIYEGDNDIARGGSPAQFIDECFEFIKLCQNHIPETEIYFMSIKPSLSRMRNWEDMQHANRMLAELSSRHEKVHYIDISSGILDDSGEPLKDLFEKDRLHLNEKGYEILTSILKKELIE